MWRGSRVALLFVILLSGMPAAWATRTCLSATIDEPVGLPDGSAHPAGKLTVCVQRDLTPVSTLHVTYVNRQPVSLLTSRRGVSEGLVERPYMMFRRTDGGRLQLYGYALPAGRHMITYLLSAPVSQPSHDALGADHALIRPELLLAARTP
jgi:hypothetical protein